MKDKLLKLRDLIDAKTIRERAILFCALAAVIVYLVYATMLSPLYARQAALRSQISQQTNNLNGMNDEITGTLATYQRDPDMVAKAKLATLRAETAALASQLAAIQSNLVPPDRVAPMLESILGKNRNLRLLGLNNLAPVPMQEPAPGATGPVGAATAAPAAAGGSANIIYRHGVELSVSGNYLDMLEYMRALESMPSRLYWGKAKLEVDEYPNSRLTLTLYTLSLDKKWMTL